MTSPTNPDRTARPSERPTTDPDGPGTTFFTRVEDEGEPGRRSSMGRRSLGGVAVGSALLGWLAAVGVTATVLAVLGAGGAAFALAQAPDGPGVRGDPGGADAATVGLVSGLVLLLVLFVAYYAGGYVAGRLARSDGATQGLAVWVWALVAAAAAAALGAVVGDRFDVLAAVGALPRIPLGEGELTRAGVVTAVLALGVSLAGSLLGGVAGTRTAAPLR